MPANKRGEEVDLSFQVSFSAPGVWLQRTSQSRSAWKLSGSGELAIAAETLVLHGRRHRPFWFSAPQEVQIAIVSVHNVAQTGRRVRFDSTTPQGEDRELVLWASDEAAAQEIARRLPQERTPQFAQHELERSDFQRNLEALGGRAHVTHALVAINCLVFAGTVYGGAGLLEPNPLVLVHFGSNFGPRTLNGEWWRLGTSMFLHFGLIHLLLNMWALWSVGQLTERLFGSGYYLVLYLLAGIGGGVASLLWHPLLNSAGASGAIFGVLGALLAFMVNPHTRIPATIAAPQRNSSLVFVAYNLLNGFTHAGIDNAAHIGGLAAGFALGWVLARPLTPEARENAGPRLATTVAGAIAVLAALSWPLAHRAGSTGELSFRNQFLEYSVKEAELVADQKQLAQLERDHKISDQEWAHRMQRDILPRWAAVEQDLIAVRVEEASPLAQVQQAMKAFLDAKRLGLGLLAEGVTEGDSQKVQRGTEVLQKSEASAPELRKLIASSL
jgi:rhomboid protease GluP